MLDLEMVRGVRRSTCRRHGEFLREGRIETVFRQDESCGQHLITLVLVVLGCETSMCAIVGVCYAGFHFDVDSCS